VKVFKSRENRVVPLYGCTLRKFFTRATHLTRKTLRLLKSYEVVNVELAWKENISRHFSVLTTLPSLVNVLLAKSTSFSSVNEFGSCGKF